MPKQGSKRIPYLLQLSVHDHRVDITLFSDVQQILSK